VLYSGGHEDGRGIRGPAPCPQHHPDVPQGAAEGGPTLGARRISAEAAP
jgi:hypothetical protein